MVQTNVANPAKNHDQLRVERRYFGEMVSDTNISQSSNKNSNDMAKGHFEIGDSDESGEDGENGQCQIRWQRGPLKSGEFDENGEYG